MITDINELLKISNDEIANNFNEFACKKYEKYLQDNLFSKRIKKNTIIIVVTDEGIKIFIASSYDAAKNKAVEIAGELDMERKQFAIVGFRFTLSPNFHLFGENTWDENLKYFCTKSSDIMRQNYN
jgi:hypothetical protein